MDNYERFLKAHGFEYPDIHKFADTFAEEMRNGLAGHGSLAMLRCGIKKGGTVKSGTAAVIDAGGTNLRIATVRVGEKAEILSVLRYPMFGVGQPISADVFFDGLAELAAPAVENADGVGFCFSYPCRGDGRDGRTLYMTKGVRIDGIEGKPLCAMTRQSLKKLGKKDDAEWILLNDSVAVLLTARMFDIPHSMELGIIVGTGTNVCCYADEENGGVALNLESACFDRISRTDIDLLFDSTLANKGQSVLEKQVAGAWLGGLVQTALSVAAKDGFLSADAFAGRPLVSEQLDDLIEGKLLGDETARAIAGAFVRRGAMLSACELAGAVVFSGNPTSAELPALAVTDGSMINRCRAFRRAFDDCLHDFENHGIYIKTVTVDEAPIIGSAAAALTVEKNL